MINSYFFEPHALVIDTIYSNDWVATMMQLMKLAGNNLYEHSIDVALLTTSMVLLGNQELLSDIPIRSLVLGALLHDIGYIGIPCIPNRLKAEQEYNSMEKMAFDIHLTAGLAQVRLHTDDPIILDIVSKHHEYLDGSGVPCGLTGNAIPLYVRMVTLANFLVNYSSSSNLLSTEKPQYLVNVLQTAVTDKHIYQKYDIAILKAFLIDLKKHFQNLSPLLAKI